MNLTKQPQTLILLLLVMSGGVYAQTGVLHKDFKALSYGFESSLDNWVRLGGGGERSTEEAISVSSKVRAQGKYSCKFSLAPQQTVAGGNRAELTYDPNLQEGDTIWLSYSLYIPKTYTDSPLNDTNGLVNWQVLGQWHQQPVWSEGETWNTYSSNHESPPIAVYYNYFDRNDPNFQRILNDVTLQSVYGFNANWNKVSTLSIGYGDSTIAVSKIEKGSWIRLKFNIKWSTQNDGYIQAWINDSEWTNGKVYGANMRNKASHYFKFGLYRNPNIPSTNTVYYDDLRLATNEIEGD